MNLAIRVTAMSSRFSLAGEIRDFTFGEVKVLLEGPLPVGSSVVVNLKAISFQGEVMFCEPKDGRYKVNVRIKDADENGLRRSPRFSVDIPAQILTLGCIVPIAGRILDISADGLGLESASPLAVADTVAVESKMNMAFGVVVHSRKQGEKIFRSGIALYFAVQRENAPATSHITTGLLTKIRSSLGRKPFAAQSAG